jgi:hypothetical protein
MIRRPRITAAGARHRPMTTDAGDSIGFVWRRRRTRRFAGGVFGAALIAAVAGAGAAAASSTAPTAATGPCAAATLGTLTAADAEVTTDIYANELAGQEVSDDVAIITGSQPLISALTHHDLAAVRKAASKLVYHPVWHIVRIRILDTSGHVLADIGGPYVIAPVIGVLRSASGAQIGAFEMSVQDDVGVTKLESHIVGDPIGIYYHGSLVASLGAHLPARPPKGASLKLGGVGYRADWLTYNAFPSGTLRALILVPPPAPALTREPCATVRANEFGRVARRLTNLLGPVTQHYTGYSYWVHVYTGAEVFVRNPDGTQLASSDGSDPPPLPLSGPLSYESQNWLVFSFMPVPPARVYLLVPAAAGAPTPTATGNALHG